MKRGKILDADRLKLNNEYRCVSRAEFQHVPRQEIAAIRRVVVLLSARIVGVILHFHAASFVSSTGSPPALPGESQGFGRVRQ